MTESTYSVGRGRPPLHTRFQKGRSGNPSGKPGPAKLAKMRFQQALLAALERRTEDLEASKPGNGLETMAKRMALDATAGRMPAVRLVLARLDAESREDDAAQNRNEADPFSLPQGKTQGKIFSCLEEMLWPRRQEEPARAGNAPPRQESDAPPAASGPEQDEARPFSLRQGKTQGSGKTISAEPTGALFEAEPAQAHVRARLLSGTASVPSAVMTRFGTAPPKTATGQRGTPNPGRNISPDPAAPGRSCSSGR